MASYTFSALRRRFSNDKGFGPLDIDIDATKWTAVIGPNGAGKSTLLRVIAGLERADGGAIYFKGKNLLDQPIGPGRAVLVWQESNLFPRLTARENVEFNWNEQALTRGVMEGYLREFGLLDNGLLDRDRDKNPLSGGEAKRVAILRALATNPAMLLLDEPFEHQDPEQKRTLVRMLRALRNHNVELPAFIVSHDVDEVLLLADYAIVLDEKGRVLAHGTPKDLLDRPPNMAAAALLGENNRISVTVAVKQASIGALSWPTTAPDNGRYSVVIPKARVSITSGTALMSVKVRNVEWRRRATSYQLTGVIEGTDQKISAIVSLREFAPGGYTPAEFYIDPKDLVLYGADGEPVRV
jgi:sulfate transport system ATP-binding protein